MGSAQPHPWLRYLVARRWCLEMACDGALVLCIRLPCCPQGLFALQGEHDLDPFLYNQPGVKACCQLDLREVGLKQAFSTAAGQLRCSLAWHLHRRGSCPQLAGSWPAAGVGAGAGAPCAAASSIRC